MQIVDQLTKQVWIIPLERPNAREAAEAFLGHVIRFTGLRDSIVSDQGGAFIDKVWKEICSCLKTIHKLPTSYHPQMRDRQSEQIKS